MLSEQDRRTLYKAFRCAHDGVCPMCGSPVGEAAGHMVCDGDPSEECGFVMRPDEIEVVRLFGSTFMGDVEGALGRMRTAHNDTEAAQAAERGE